MSERPEKSFSPVVALGQGQNGFYSLFQMACRRQKCFDLPPVTLRQCQNTFVLPSKTLRQRQNILFLPLKSLREPKKVLRRTS
jgi:hypothetical protein